jgi:tetratricopeptide (TPR) repeat protein
MTISTKLWLTAGLLLLGAGGAVAWTVAGTASSIRDEYPDAPFPRVGPDFPRIITTEESPASGAGPSTPARRVATEAFWERYREIRKYLREGGVMSQASAEEREAYRLALDAAPRQYVAARDLAIGVLKTNPRSMPARLVLAVVESEGEQNFARALFLIRKLRHEVHKRGREAPHDESAREWYLRILDLEYDVLEHIGNNSEADRVADLIEQIYEPVPWMHVWPLARANKLDQARKWLDRAEQDGRMQLKAMNSRLMLEFESGYREAGYHAAKRAAEAFDDSSVIWNNFAECCWCSFRFEEAVAALNRAASCDRIDFYGSPSFDLSRMLADKGRVAEAWATLRQGQEHRSLRKPFTWVVDQHRFDSATAYVLFQIGLDDQACRWARRAYERPHRSNTSDEPRDLEFNAAFLFWIMLRQHITGLRERELGGDPGATARRLALEAESWALTKQIRKLLADDKYLIQVLRAYCPGSPYQCPLFLPDIAAMLPAGVARDAARRARTAEELPAGLPYLDSIEAELEWRSGRYQAALGLCEKARAGIDRVHELPLRARLAVIAAECLRRLGRESEAMVLYDEALANCPAVFRLLDVAIPVAVTVDSSPLARQAADRVLLCPRFRADAHGFPLIFRANGDQLAFELQRQGTVRHCRDAIIARAPLKLENLLATTVEQLTARVMSPGLSLTAADINTLDSSLIAARR